jgi:acetolactate synthase-1/2/3 large subunit
MNDLNTFHIIYIMRGANRLVQNLINKGVNTIFGYPGGAILPVLDALSVSGKIKYILSRTEQGGGFMADGYANATGKLGVVMTTSGPGALNAVTCLQNALSDGTPLLALTGQVATTVLGTDAFQEADVVNITKPCTKMSAMIKSIDNIDDLMDDAVSACFSGRHGPVLLDLPKNIMSAPAASDFATIKEKPVASFYIENTVTIEDITKMILASKKPVILAGNGVIKAGPEAVHHLRMLASIYKIPVTTTLMGLGIYDEKQSLSLKMLGMHGSVQANMAIQHCDLLLNFGSRFDDRITGLVTAFAPLATIVHVDICASNINKVIKTQKYINNSCAPVLRDLVELGIASIYDGRCSYDRRRFIDWHTTIKNWTLPFSFPQGKAALQGREVINALNDIIYSDEFKGTKFRIVADVGAHQMWAAQFIDYNRGRVNFLTSGGLGTMGYAVPASIGAAIGQPDECVICICGDGGFTMSFVELLTAIENKVNVKILVINNSYQLMVKMWQEKFYEGRLLGVKMNNPPFHDVCASMGCETMLIDERTVLRSSLTKFLKYKGGPIVANVITDSSEAVLPMVSPGKALHDMIVDEVLDERLTGDAPC